MATFSITDVQLIYSALEKRPRRNQLQIYHPSPHPPLTHLHHRSGGKRGPVEVGRMPVLPAVTFVTVIVTFYLTVSER